MTLQIHESQTPMKTLDLVAPASEPRSGEPQHLQPITGADGDRGHHIVQLIGNTPLIDLSALVSSPTVQLLAKAEYLNPGGSVKDRAALAMVREALESGRLVPGARVLDATSGNTGIAYAMLGAAMGFGVTLCLPQNASVERQRLLRAFDAELVLTDPLDGSDGAIREAKRLAQERLDLVYLDQYSNPENWRAHYRTTGPEIWRQTEGRVTHFVTGLGTSGTFTGVSRFLTEQSSTIKTISIQPDSPIHGLEGMKHMDSAIVPAIYDPHLADDDRPVTTEAAYAMVKRLARDHGLLVGVSAAGNVAAALEVAEALQSGIVVTILCDDGMKYLSESFWEET